MEIDILFCHSIGGEVGVGTAYIRHSRRQEGSTGMLPPHNSLVKYDNPVLVSTTSNRNGKGAKKKGQAPSAERQSSQTEDILNSILPPRCDTAIPHLIQASR